MGNHRKTGMCLLLALWLVTLTGCGKKADETKPIAEVKAEAEKMDLGQLKSMAMKYKDMIEAKKADVEKLTAKLKGIPITKMLDEEAKQLKSKIGDLQKSISALQVRFEIYYSKLKEKGGSL